MPLGGSFTVGALRWILPWQGKIWRGVRGLHPSPVVRELSGRPAVALHGRAQAIAENLGLTQWALSLSRSEGYASAFVIAWQEGG